MTSLTPCPFCGEITELEIDDVTTESFAVCCGNCGCIGPQAISTEGAAETWDSRS